MMRCPEIVFHSRAAMCGFGVHPTRQFALPAMRCSPSRSAARSAPEIQFEDSASDELVTLGLNA